MYSFVPREEPQEEGERPGQELLESINQILLDQRNHQLRDIQHKEVIIEDIDIPQQRCFYDQMFLFGKNQAKHHP